jgi:O-antigen ligase
MANKNSNLYFRNILNILIAFYPITYFFGNLAININTLLIIFAGIIIFKNKIFDFRSDKITIILLIFFIYLIIITIFNYFSYSITVDPVKSFLFLRYFLLVLVIRHLVIDGLNIKFFVCASLLIVGFISVDVIYQFYNNGVNLTNYIAPSDVHNTGVFNEERITGNFIRIFVSLSIIPFAFLFYNKKKLFFLSIVFIILISGSGAFLSGNRMPMILFALFFILTIFLVRKIRVVFLSSFIIMLLSITCIAYFSEISNEKVDKKKYGYVSYYKSFYLNGVAISKFLKEEIGKKYPNVKKGTYYVEEWAQGKNTKYKMSPAYSGHHLIYRTAIDTWKMNPIFGNGIKSFRVRCNDKIHIPNRICQSHPHNYYLEILNDVGIVGAILLLIIFFFLLRGNFKRKFYEENFIYISFLFFLVIEFLPIRSSGSLFSTSNSTFIFLSIGMLIGACSNNTKEYDK